MAKTNAQRCKEYRERQRLKHNKGKKGKPKSNAERARECRLRKKAREAMRLIDNNLWPSSETGNVVNQDDIKIINTTHENASNKPGPSNMHEPIYDPNKPYSRYHRDSLAHREFNKKFTNNPFGHACSVCDRLWFRDELRASSPAHERILNKILPHTNSENIRLCYTCCQALKRNTIPAMSTYNGFKYPDMPDDLPPLDLLSERLISPRIPFVQIRRLRHVNGQHGIYGQVINVPASMDTMVHQLPRNIDDDHCINTHIKYRKTYRSSYVSDLIDKRTIKAWLRYLINSPLYRLHGVTINEPFFEVKNNIDEISVDDLSEHIPIEDSLVAQQQTLLWNAENNLRIAPGENNVLKSLLFDEHAEELSFPAIYLGQLRKFRGDVRITPFMMATSELRRSDRRGVTPYHLLYLAMKLMRLRIRDSLPIASKSVDENTNIIREQVESEDYINNSIENNIAFLRAIPNSTWYWAERKRDLFAMIRQLGKPTIFLTLSANEIRWNDLLQTLYKLKNHSEIAEEEIAQLNYLQKSTLVNEDPVTCAIHFNKLVNVLMDIIQSKKWGPFGRHRVVHYFKRIEFSHSGSPHAHILLWLENAPGDALRADREDAVALIDQLIAVSTTEASGHIELQTHQHTSSCYKRVVPYKPQKCRFETPFMPSRRTVILTPMQRTDPWFTTYAERYARLRFNLESNDYLNIDTFYAHNNVISDEEYTNILRAGITRPRVFLRRQPREKWHIPFNPFILNVLQSSIDIRFITDECSCASYITEYVNKTDWGTSDLQRKIVETMDHHPEFNIVEVTRKLSIDVINSVELTSQEAAWYLLREPMSKSSVTVAYIPTVWPLERQRIKKTQRELNRMQCGEDSTDVWKENWFDKYEKRPKDMKDITLAQFVANYTSNAQGVYTKRKKSRVIRYRNYDIVTDLNEHKREMVTLHIPFRSEEEEILADMEFIRIYDKNEELILQNHREFLSNFDISKTIKICRELCGEKEPDEDEIEVYNVAKLSPEPNSFKQNSSSSNYQSLEIHKENLTDVVIPQQVNILILWKTGLKDEYNTGISKFDCVVRFKRSDVQAAGVAVYENDVNNTNIVTPRLNINFQVSNTFSVNTSAIGDVCAAECNIYSYQKVIIVAIYISPNHSIKDIIQFIHRSLAVYTVEVAAFLDPELGRIPMIFSGHFNVNFALTESQPLIDFLYDKFQLETTNNFAGTTIGSETTIDAVFSRFLDRIQSKVFVSYFSYHQPITSFVQKDDINDGE